MGTQVLRKASLTEQIP